jgi:integrase
MSACLVLTFAVVCGSLLSTVETATQSTRDFGVSYLWFGRTKRTKSIEGTKAMPNIQERKSANGKTSYRVQVRLKGYPTQTASFARLTDARKWATQTEAAIQEGRHFKHAEAKRHSMGQAIDRYVAEIMPRKPKTAKIQTPHALWWKERIGDYTLADVTPALIIEHRAALEKETSATNANRYMAVLSHLFTIATREWGWCEDSPFRKIQRLKEPRGRVRFLDDGERARLLEACKENPNPNLYPAVVLALSTGCRKGEILSLRWPDVDLERGIIMLQDTKNGERRGVPLAGRALEVMKECSRFRRVDCNYVFPCTSLPKPADVDRDFARAREKAGIKNCRFHDLRHSAASYLAMNGATLAEIAEVLGHKTLAMVKRYAHLSQPHTSGVVARMNAAIFPAQSKEESAS